MTSAFVKQTTLMTAPTFSPEPTPSLVSPQSTEVSASECKKPRKNRSAYTLFALDVKPKLKASSSSKMSCTDLQTTISQLWKDLSAEERKKYQDQANEEKLHYMLKLKKFYENASAETLEEANKPKTKRPYSAYCYFVKEIRHVIKLPDAKFKMQEILKQASEKWRMLTEEEKAVYQEKAKQARENQSSEAVDSNEALELARIEEEAAKVELEAKTAKKKTQEKASKTSSTNKKRGLHFSKDIREKMEKLEKEAIKKVKTSSLDEEKNKIASTTRIQGLGLQLETLLGQPRVSSEDGSLNKEVKQEDMVQEMLRPLPIKVQSAQQWPNLAQNGWNLQMPGLNPNVNIMRDLSLAMGFEQVRRQLINQLLVKNIAQAALPQNGSIVNESNIEVKAECL